MVRCLSFGLIPLLALGCASEEITPTPTPALDAQTDRGADTSDASFDTTATDASRCAVGETVCGAACIGTGDCSRAVTTESPAARGVWINGATYKRFLLADTSGIKALRVGGAVVAFRAEDASHLWAEIPPGVLGEADVEIDTAAGTTITRRVLEYGSAPTGSSWTKKTMATARGGFPAMATTFDNRALVAAGYTKPTVADCTDTADLFDRSAGASTPATNTMSTKRWTATAVTLLDGRTLVAGACYTVGCGYDAGAIDLFDPKTSKFTAAKGKLTVARGFLRSLLLADGRALFASDELPSLELYDPVADATSTVAGSTFSAPSPVTGHIARLRDGRVLMVPGAGKPNVLFDPVKGTLTPTGDSLPQVPDALVPLGDGRVFAIGGQLLSDKSGTLYQDTSDAIAVFDPKSGKFSSWSAKLAKSRSASTVVLARDGGIYVIGGWSGNSKVFISCTSDPDLAGLTFLSSVEILDPVAGTVKAGPSLPEPNLSLRSTILADGSIVAGGGTPCGSAAVSYPSVYFLEAPPVK